jgi:transglutaminase-like putative cysteine protease
MWYEIVHSIRYDYSSPVSMGPHTIRLLPRSDASQRVISAGWDIRPIPSGCARGLDMNGNDVLEVWWAEKTPSFALRFRSTVETLRENPFDFVPLHPSLPATYTSGTALLAPFRTPEGNLPEITAFCHDIRAEAKGQAMDFLFGLCRRIKELFTLEIREEGAPRSPAETWVHQRGACRDWTVFFMECCRQEGFASRFVSGYYEDDPDRVRRDLHAWAEVYVEGGGWRGFDPTIGLAVGDRHMAVAAGLHPTDAAPVSGSFYGEGISSTMGFELSLTRKNSINSRRMQ